MLEWLETEIRKVEGKPVIFLFPEAVLHLHSITRQQGKKLAVDINRILSEHGNAFAAYSVYERRTGKSFSRKTNSKNVNPLITNSGYLIKPFGKTNPEKYLVYPKVTVRTGGKLTGLDSIVVKNEAKKRFQEANELWNILASKVTPSFPRIKIAGKDVELRVCADVRSAKDIWKVPARKKQNPAHLILVPAFGLELWARNLSHLTKHLHHNGMAVIADSGYDQTALLHNNNGKIVTHIPVRPEQKKGFIRIRHIK
jgi:hypothetical protein